MGSLQQTETASPSRIGGDAQRAEQQRVVLWVAVVQFFYLVGQRAYAPVSPFIWTQTGRANGDDVRGASLHGWGTSINAFAQFLSASLLGVLSDRFGRRPFMMLSCFGQVVDFLAAALAVQDSPLWLGGNSAEFMLAARCFAGLCGNLNILSKASMGDVSTTTETSTRNFTFLFATIGVAGIVGIAVGSALACVSGPHIPMFISAGANVLNILIVIFLLPEPLRPENRKQRHWCSASPFCAIAFMLTSRFLIVYAVMSILVSFSFYLLITFLVPYSDIAFDVDPAFVQGLLLAFCLSNVLACALGLRPMVRCRGEIWVLRVGCVFICSCFLLFALIIYTGVFELMYVVSMACGFWYISIPAQWSIASRCVGPDQQGVFQAGDGGLDLIAKALSSGLVSLTLRPLSAAGQLNAIWWIALGAQLPAAGITLSIRRFLPGSFRESPKDEENVEQKSIEWDTDERSRTGGSRSVALCRTLSSRRTSPQIEDAKNEEGAGQIEAAD